LNVLFIYSGAENLGIQYLSSFLKDHGHTTSLLLDPGLFSAGAIIINNSLLARFLDIDDKIVEKAIAAKPDLIAFSCVTGTYRWSLNLAKKIRQRSNIPIVFGGIHVTSIPEEVMQHDFIDFAVRGEGEHAMLELLESLNHNSNVSLGNIKNLVYRKDGKVHYNPLRDYIKNLDNLPFPDKSLFYDKIKIWSENYVILTSRGCPFACTYCCNNIYHTLYQNQNHVRRRSPENVIAELKLAKEKWNPRLITFTDDVFANSLPWLEKFIPLYKKEIGLPFNCLTHPAILTRRTAELLKSGGCWMITIGIQSGSERVRRDIYNRLETNARIEKTIQYARDAGIKLISVDAILGCPTETKDDLEKSFDLYKQIQPDRIITFWLTYYPNTTILKFAEDAGVLTGTEIARINEGYTRSPHMEGSITKDKRKIYLKHETQLQLLCLSRNDKLRKFLGTILGYLPSRTVNHGIMVVNAIRNRDFHTINHIKYLWSKKRVP